MLLKSPGILSFLVFSALVLYLNADNSTTTTTTRTTTAATKKATIKISTTPETTAAIITTSEATTVQVTTAKPTVVAVPSGKIMCKTANCKDFDYEVDTDSEENEANDESTTMSGGKITNSRIMVLIVLLIPVRH